MDNNDERVLVVPRQELMEAGLISRGFRSGTHDRVMDIIGRSARFMARPQAEEDPAWKQIIPYAIVAHRQRIFLLRRTKKGGEPRLHDLFSIGVGGHINPAPVGVEQCVEDGLRRELEEELAWEIPYEFRPIGTLNDDSNAVGQVHFGLVFRVEVTSPGVSVRETEILEGGFVEIEELRRRLPQMETWSQWVIQALFGSAG